MGLIPSSSEKAAAAPSAPAAAHDLGAEAVRLRRLIETQPSCLLRVALDGALLAVNEAALGLLGADGLAQVLGKPLTEHIDGDHRPRWSEFAERVRASGSSSLECDLVHQTSGDRRAVLIQGAAFLDHPDGVESVIVTIRDTTASRRLEQVLESEAASRRSLEDTRARLEESLTERQRLSIELARAKAETERVAAAAAGRDSEHGQLDEHRRTELSKLQHLVEQQQLALMEKERQHRELVDTLRAELAQAIAEQTRLATALEARVAERERLEGDWTSASAELERTLRDERQQSAQSRERTHQKLVDLEGRLSSSVAEQARLAAMLDDHRRLEDQRADVRSQLERALAEAREQGERALAEARAHTERAVAEAKEQGNRALVEAHDLADRRHGDLHQAIADLEARLSRAAGEHARLASLAEERDGDRQRLEAKHAEVRAQLERTLTEARDQAKQTSERLQQEVAELELQLSRADTEHARLRSLVEERDGDRQRLEAKHAEVRGQLERALAEAREHVARRGEQEERALADLEVQLSHAVAEQTRLAAVLATRDTERHRLEAEHAAARARLEQLRAEAQLQHEQLGRELVDLQSKYDQALSERERLAALVERRHLERQRIDAELGAARAEVERLTREHEHALLIKEDEQREVVANLQAELALSMAVQKRAETELSKSEANLKRQVAEYSSDRAQAERALGDAIIKKNQILKVLADQRVEVQRVAENARALEPLAAAGRLAVGVGRELQELTTEIDARARFLLSLCALETSYRSELETLRAEAVRAASLARQFALTNLRQPAIPFEDSLDAAEGTEPKPKESAGKL